ncbi:hypothetical protein [Bradyrhizobium sp. Ash2021]|uniref:hypothetical protein n=1 Tax=Bradyrhizobium sp. Ash2021 TaxID=2954771 RepID=UPI0028153F3C|nr:hypothetical protein [Bradyrhizobium sp. Ash2021]WMT76286.1 hypothetical protein NL528_07910 [Bradyrhizobium sp. Ash2021]
MAKKAMKLKESTRRDGRKAMLTYMHPDLIQLVKDAAAANDLKAWQVIENAVARALKWKKP